MFIESVAVGLTGQSKPLVNKGLCVTYVECRTLKLEEIIQDLLKAENRDSGWLIRETSCVPRCSLRCELHWALSN